MLTRSQILRALRSAARKLGRAPTRAEFMRLTGIHHCKLLSHFPGYRDAVRAAGLSLTPVVFASAPPLCLPTGPG